MAASGQLSGRLRAVSRDRRQVLWPGWFSRLRGAPPSGPGWRHTRPAWPRVRLRMGVGVVFHTAKRNAAT